MKRITAVLLMSFATLILLTISAKVSSFSSLSMAIFSIVLIGIAAVFVIVSYIEICDWIEKDDGPLKFLYNKTSGKKKSYKGLIWIGSILLIFILLIALSKNAFKDGVSMYNNSKMLHNSYIQKTQEKEGFYDKLWRTYLQKDKITNINKETFIEVTKIIMENRRDGQNVAWKWLKENQQIPYEEFTCFYKDLSDFVTSQREGYFAIEKQCQEIANSNNTLLDTFPHNLYNKLIKCERINFEYGFLSDSTNTVFKNKIE
jgi:hypothetical protein